MTRTTHRQLQTVASQAQPVANHGHKRKGKPVETWMMELEKAQDEENCTQNLDLSAIEQIANGVEQMVFSWGLDKRERGQEYANMSKSLGMENSQMVFPWESHKRETRGDGFIDATDLGCGAWLPFMDQSPKGIHQAPSPFGKQPSPSTAPSSTVVEQSEENGEVEEMSVGRLPSTYVKEHCEACSARLHAEDLQPLTGAGPCSACQCKHNSRFNPNHKQGMCKLNDWLLNSSQEGGEKFIRKNRARKQKGMESREENSGSLGVSTNGSTFTDDQHVEPVLRTSEKSLRGQMCMQKGQLSPVPCHRRASSVRDDSTLHCTEDQFPLFPLRDPSLDQSSQMDQSPFKFHSPATSVPPESGQHYDDFSQGSKVISRAELYEESPCSNGGAGASSNSCLSYLHSSPRHKTGTETLEVGGHVVKVAALHTGNDVLETKFENLVKTAGVQEGHLNTGTPQPSLEVEELQIALLECAMEYELKTIETKMKMQEMKSQSRQSLVSSSKSEQDCPERVMEVSSNQRKLEYQRLQQMKKHVAKLQHEKGSLAMELHALKKKERQFERQRRSLDDALHRVNRLQREVVKKEQELVEWQLKEKETKAQLQDVEENLKRAHFVQASQQLEPKKLLTLLPALREWLRSLKKKVKLVTSHEVEFMSRTVVMSRCGHLYPKLEARLQSSFHVKVGTARPADRRQFQEKDDPEPCLTQVMDGYILPPPAVQTKDKLNLPAHLGPLGVLSEQLEQQSDMKLSLPQMDVIICCLTKEIQALQKELTKLAKV